MEKEHSSGVVVYCGSPRRYLILKYAGGHWDLIKGRMEPGESEKDTAEREAREEAGLEQIEFADGFLQNIRYFFTRDGSPVAKNVTFLLGRIKDERVVLSDEHTDYAWMDYPDALKRLTFETARKVIRDSEVFLSKMH
ncbi:MAG: NUDIX domain-containing protein [archaeon]